MKLSPDASSHMQFEYGDLSKLDLAKTHLSSPNSSMLWRMPGLVLGL